MDESLYFVYTRNCKQETIYYMQETKTIFGRFFTLILKRNINLATGKRKIRLNKKKKDKVLMFQEQIRND